MEEEVQLFVRRVSKLEGLLKELYMKSNSTGDGNVILHLLDKCSKILDRVNGDKSLSAGGRFEWVNSILVKVGNRPYFKSSVGIRHLDFSACKKDRGCSSTM